LLDLVLIGTVWPAIADIVTAVLAGCMGIPSLLEWTDEYVLGVAIQYVEARLQVFEVH